MKKVNWFLISVCICMCMCMYMHTHAQAVYLTCYREVNIAT